MLLKEDYEELVKKTTYACYPYDTNSYKLTASGAILDAIRYCKPVIYIKNDYFDSVFKNVGNIGFSCNSEEEFIQKIHDVNDNFDIAVYNVQRENLKRLTNRFSLETFSKNLENILRNIIGF